MKLDTFLCFVDFNKAFDSVNHLFLWHKLKMAKIHGNMIRTIQSMYSNLQSCVRLNGDLTDWFTIETGVRQGDNMAPTLFAIFINDLTADINSLHCGVKLGENTDVSILLYADDIVLIADSERNLQQQLSKLHEWSSKWLLKVNSDKP